MTERIMVVPTIIFGAFNTSTKIAGYFDLIESVNGNVRKLLHQSFKSAVQNLVYARTASEANRMGYIKTARKKFIDAVSVEENENLILALVGLAICQHLLGDDTNAAITVARIEKVELSVSEKSKAILITGAKMISIGTWYSLYSLAKKKNPYTSDFNDRIKAFENLKKRALAEN